MTAKRGNQTLVAIALMVGAVWTFGGIEAIAKILVVDMSVPLILWFRLCFFMLFVGFLIRPTRWPGLLANPKASWLSIRALMPLTASLLTHIAFKTMTLADVTAITFASPFFLTALSVLLLGERVGVHRWTAIGIGFVGVLVIIRPGPGVFDWISLLPVGAAFLYACFQLTTRYVSAGGGTDPNSTLLYTGLIGLVATSLFVPFFWQIPTLDQFGLLALSGALHLMSHYFLIHAFSRAPAAVLSPFNFTKMLAAVLLGYLIFSELPDLRSILGIAIVVSSGLYMLYRERAQARNNGSNG